MVELSLCTVRKLESKVDSNSSILMDSDSKEVSCYMNLPYGHNSCTTVWTRLHPPSFQLDAFVGYSK